MVKGDTRPAEVFEEPYPCSRCPNYDTCAAEELSCQSFYIYVTERGRLDLEHRNPSMGWYYKTFVKRSKSDARYERMLAELEEQELRIEDYA